jgi:hypothetical protein
VLAVTGCGGKGNCIPDEYYLGPNIGPARTGTNGANLVVGWHRLEEHGDQNDQGALFDTAGNRIAGSEFEVPDPLIQPTFIGAPDGALVIGTIRDLDGERSAFALQSADGTISTPIETAFRIRSAIYEGPGFLLATDQGLARMSLDGTITEELTLPHPMQTLVGGTSVTWAIESVGGMVSGIRIAHGGGALDATPKPITNFIYSPLTASRGDEAIVAGFSGNQLTWSVLDANGSVQTTSAMTTAGVSTTTGSALVAESSGYLLFLADTDSRDLGVLRITPAGVPGEYIVVAPSASVDAVALDGRVLAAFPRSRVETGTPGIDAVIVENAAPPSAVITLEDDTTGHIEERTCHWYE